MALLDAELFTLDLFDPYSRARQEGATLRTTVSGDEVLMLLRHQDVRAAARDWSTFTSATPRGVSIPTQMHIRPVPQLPIETDPSEHGRYRALIEPIFGRAAIEAHRSVAHLVASSSIDRLLAERRLEVVMDFALPLVAYTLANVLGRPDSEVQQLLQWAPDVFADVDGHQVSNADLDEYLEKVVDEAMASPGPDAFGQLATASFGDRRLTRDEILGYGSLLIAAGRDTVVGALSTSIWYLANNEGVRRLLVAQPDLIPSAIEEFLRLMTPLHFMGRVAKAERVVDGSPIARGDLVALVFASANRDESTFDDPNEFRIDRKPNRHLAFGHGPHLCLGIHLARMELAVALTELLIRVPTYQVANPTVPFLFDAGVGMAQNGFSQLTIEAPAEFE